MTTTVDPVHLIPPRVRQFARRSLNRAGFEMSRHPFGVRMAQLLTRQAVSMVVDVGANEGQYARQLRLNGYPGHMVSVEPLQQAFTRLEAASRHDDRWDVRRAALADHNGLVTVNVAANSYSSSVLPMTEAHRRSDPQSVYTTTEIVGALTLDALLAEYDICPARTAVKIDVQGFERAVLAGAADALPNLAVVQCELSLVELYTGQWLMPAMVELLAGAGLTLWSIEPGFTDPGTGQMLQCDGVFVRDER